LADGKNAAAVIGRYLRGEALTVPAEVRLPEVYVPAAEGPEADGGVARAVAPQLDPRKRTENFAEVELGLTEGTARREARRCLRCDLEFTQPEIGAEETVAVGEEQA